MVERFMVIIERGVGEPAPTHPAFNDIMPGPDGKYRIWFVAREGRFPRQRTLPYEMRYVEDYLAIYQNATIKPLDKLRDDYRELFSEGYTVEKKPE